MKIVLLNTYAKRGGASVAATRLSAALRGSGADATLLVQDAEDHRHTGLMTTSDRWAARRPLLDILPALAWRRRRSPHWGNAWLSNPATRKALQRLSPDIIHLHWINHGMLSIRDIARLKRPIVWTLHDAWPLTGGCHSPHGCDRFERGCGHCPELGSSRRRDLSRWNWKRKQAVWPPLDLTLVSPSRWLAGMATRSPLWDSARIEVIPNALDPSIFRLRDRAAAREALGLPVHDPMILFAAHGADTDWNKGMDLWRETLALVMAARTDVRAIVAGMKPGLRPAPNPSIHELGILSADRMALAMAAANVTVVPSRLENLPNVVSESLACGTPVAAFATGGIPEMIRTPETGYLATPYDPADLAHGIGRLLRQRDQRRDACSKQSNIYTPERVAQQHLVLYDSLAK